MGPGWKAWLGEVVAERARCGDPWADWDGEADAERCPPAEGTEQVAFQHGRAVAGATAGTKGLSYLVWAATSAGHRKTRHTLSQLTQQDTCSTGNGCTGASTLTEDG